MTEETTQELLKLVFPSKKAREHWLNTHNLLFGGRTPADVIADPDDGEGWIISELKAMLGEGNG